MTCLFSCYSGLLVCVLTLLIRKSGADVIRINGGVGLEDQKEIVIFSNETEINIECTNNHFLLVESSNGYFSKMEGNTQLTITNDSYPSHLMIACYQNGSFTKLLKNAFIKIVSSELFADVWKDNVHLTPAESGRAYVIKNKELNKFTVGCKIEESSSPFSRPDSNLKICYQSQSIAASNTSILTETLKISHMGKNDLLLVKCYEDVNSIFGKPVAFVRERDDLKPILEAPIDESRGFRELKLNDTLKCTSEKENYNKHWIEVKLYDDFDKTKSTNEFYQNKTGAPAVYSLIESLKDCSILEVACSVADPFSSPLIKYKGRKEEVYVLPKPLKVMIDDSTQSELVTEKDSVNVTCSKMCSTHTDVELIINLVTQNNPTTLELKNNRNFYKIKCTEEIGSQSISADMELFYIKKDFEIKLKINDKFTDSQQNKVFPVGIKDKFYCSVDKEKFKVFQNIIKIKHVLKKSSCSLNDSTKGKFSDDIFSDKVDFTKLKSGKVVNLVCCAFFEAYDSKSVIIRQTKYRVIKISNSDDLKMKFKFNDYELQNNTGNKYRDGLKDGDTIVCEVDEQFRDSIDLKITQECLTNDQKKDCPKMNNCSIELILESSSANCIMKCIVMYGNNQRIVGQRLIQILSKEKKPEYTLNTKHSIDSSQLSVLKIGSNISCIQLDKRYGPLELKINSEEHLKWNNAGSNYSDVIKVSTEDIWRKIGTSTNVYQHVNKKDLNFTCTSKLLPNYIVKNSIGFHILDFVVLNSTDMIFHQSSTVSTHTADKAVSTDCKDYSKTTNNKKELYWYVDMNQEYMVTYVTVGLPAVENHADIFPGVGLYVTKNISDMKLLGKNFCEKTFQGSPSTLYTVDCHLEGRYVAFIGKGTNNNFLSLCHVILYTEEKPNYVVKNKVAKLIPVDRRDKFVLCEDECEDLVCQIKIPEKNGLKIECDKDYFPRVNKMDRISSNNSLHELELIIRKTKEYVNLVCKGIFLNTDTSYKTPKKELFVIFWKIVDGPTMTVKFELRTDNSLNHIQNPPKSAECKSSCKTIVDGNKNKKCEYLRQVLTSYTDREMIYEIQSNSAIVSKNKAELLIPQQGIPLSYLPVQHLKCIIKVETFSKPHAAEKKAVISLRKSPSSRIILIRYWAQESDMVHCKTNGFPNNILKWLKIGRKSKMNPYNPTLNMFIFDKITELTCESECGDLKSSDTAFFQVVGKILEVKVQYPKKMDISKNRHTKGIFCDVKSFSNENVEITWQYYDILRKTLFYSFAPRQNDFYFPFDEFNSSFGFYTFRCFARIGLFEVSSYSLELEIMDRAKFKVNLFIKEKKYYIVKDYVMVDPNDHIHCTAPGSVTHHVSIIMYGVNMMHSYFYKNVSEINTAIVNIASAPDIMLLFCKIHYPVLNIMEEIKVLVIKIDPIKALIPDYDPVKYEGDSLRCSSIGRPLASNRDWSVPSHFPPKMSLEDMSHVNSWLIIFNSSNHYVYNLRILRVECNVSIVIRNHIYNAKDYRIVRIRQKTIRQNFYYFWHTEIRTFGVTCFDRVLENPISGYVTRNWVVYVNNDKDAYYNLIRNSSMISASDIRKRMKQKKQRQSMQREFDPEIYSLSCEIRLILSNNTSGFLLKSKKIILIHSKYMTPILTRYIAKKATKPVLKSILTKGQMYYSPEEDMSCSMYGFPGVNLVMEYSQNTTIMKKLHVETTGEKMIRSKLINLKGDDITLRCTANFNPYSVKCEKKPRKITVLMDELTKPGVTIRKDGIIQVNNGSKALQYTEKDLLNCTATGTPPPMIKWTLQKGPKKMIDKYNKGGKPFTMTRESGFKLDDWFKTHEGHYTLRCSACIMINYNCEYENYADLAFQYIPGYGLWLDPDMHIYRVEDTPRCTTSKEENVATISVDISAENSPFLRKFDADSAKFEILDLPMYKDTLEVTCIASTQSNEILGSKNISLDIRSATTVKIYPEASNQYFKQGFVFKCKFEGFPPGIFLWKVDNPDYIRHLLTFKENKVTINILPMSIQNSQVNLHCFAIDDKGIVHKDTKQFFISSDRIKCVDTIVTQVETHFIINEGRLFCGANACGMLSKSITVWSVHNVYEYFEKKSGYIDASFLEGGIYKAMCTVKSLISDRSTTSKIITFKYSRKIFKHQFTNLKRTMFINSFFGCSAKGYPKPRIQVKYVSGPNRLLQSPSYVTITDKNALGIYRYTCVATQSDIHGAFHRKKIDVTFHVERLNLQVLTFWSVIPPLIFGVGLILILFHAANEEVHEEIDQIYDHVSE